MGKEIERKFLVKTDRWVKPDSGNLYRQGYISSTRKHTVRVRVAGDKGILTIKGKSAGFSRAEYEYEIPQSDAEEMLLNLCENLLIEKLRYKIKQDRLTWEVDEFLGENEGLLLAELELETEDQDFEKPEWLGREVTGDYRYYNASLSRHPFKKWKR
jgi:adenylate cyclase